MTFLIVVLATLVLGCFGAPQQPLNVDLARNVKIVNGVNAAQGEFPFQVSLQNNGRHSCGATILNNEWVLTAAHCIVGQNINSATVRVGSNNINSGGSVHRIISWQMHERYQNSAFWNNDIAVMRVSPAISYSASVRPTVLPAAGAEPSGGQASVAIGWGNACFGCASIPNLQKVNLVVYSHADCLRLYGSGPTTSMVCSGRPENQQGVCQGDSGGPLLVNGVQIGVTSWTRIPCASLPAVWTKVSHYRDWIRQRTGV